VGLEVGVGFAVIAASSGQPADAGAVVLRRAASASALRFTLRNWRRIMNAAPSRDLIAVLCRPRSYRLQSVRLAGLVEALELEPGRARRETSVPASMKGFTAFSKAARFFLLRSIV
jgi:hypothetical protein